MSVPARGSYWVVPGRLLAGQHPGAHTAPDARRRLDAFRAAGVTAYVDLTEEDEWPAPYRALLADGLRYERRPIRDFGCPSREELRSTLDLLDAELARGETVYVHCQGGRGRTGTSGRLLARPPRGFGRRGARADRRAAPTGARRGPVRLAGDSGAAAARADVGRGVSGGA